MIRAAYDLARRVLEWGGWEHVWEWAATILLGH